MNVSYVVQIMNPNPMNSFSMMEIEINKDRIPELLLIRKIFNLRDGIKISNVPSDTEISEGELENILKKKYYTIK